MGLDRKFSLIEVDYLIKIHILAKFHVAETIFEGVRGKKPTVFNVILGGLAIITIFIMYLDLNRKFSLIEIDYLIKIHILAMFHVAETIFEGVRGKKPSVFKVILGGFAIIIIFIMCLDLNRKYH